MSSDNGIAFYNSQMMWSVTPIWDFQKQMASDPRGQRATRMYQFSATTQDYAQLTIVAVFGPNGLQLGPQYQHNVDAIICSVPQPGRNFARTIASLIGFNQTRITQQVKEGALPKMQQNVVQEAAELGAERTAQEAAIRNVTYEEYLIGYDRLALGNLLIEGLSMRSRPIRGRVRRRPALARCSRPGRADLPSGKLARRARAGGLRRRPPELDHDESLAGLLQSDEVRGVENLMLGDQAGCARHTHAGCGRAGSQRRLSHLPRGGRRGEGANDAQGGGHPGQAAGAEPTFRPTRGAFSSPGSTNSSSTSPFPHERTAWVPWPGPLPRSTASPAKGAEFVISFQVTPETQTSPVRLAGKIESFDPGTSPNTKVYALNDDESKAQELTIFAAAPSLDSAHPDRGSTHPRPPEQPATARIRHPRSLAARPDRRIRVQLVRTSASPAAGIGERDVEAPPVASRPPSRR